MDVFSKKRLAWIRTHARLQRPGYGLEPMVVTTAPSPRMRVKGVHVAVICSRTRVCHRISILQYSTRRRYLRPKPELTLRNTDGISSNFDPPMSNASTAIASKPLLKMRNSVGISSIQNSIRRRQLLKKHARKHAKIYDISSNLIKF